MEGRGLVLYWAKRYAPLLQGRAAVDFDDLTQAGFLGLLEAAQTFDGSKGAWSTWASVYIRRAMLNALGVRRNAPEMLSLDAPAYAGEDCDVSLADTIPDDSLPDPDARLLQDELSQTVRQAVRRLPEDQRRVAQLHGLQGRSFATCDRLLGLNPGKALTIGRKAYKTLHGQLRSLDEQTRFHAHKGVQAFHSSGSSVVEDAVIWREEQRIGKNENDLV